MKISITIMAHPKRHQYAYRLFTKLKPQGFCSVSIVYDLKNDEWRNGRSSLLDHGESDWHVVIQDDAIISDNFYKNVVKAIRHVPRRTLISFYTGTVRPRPTRVANAVLRATAEQSSWLVAETLMWGVCIAIPTNMIDTVVTQADKLTYKYDIRLGSVFKRNNLPVYYTNPSLVDHDYTIGSLIGNDYSALPRTARNYEPALVSSWNEQGVTI